MINPEILKTRKRLITHASCPDGLASAMLIRAVLPDIEIEFVQYSTDQHKTMEAREGDMFCDFTPHRDRVTDWVGVGAVVLDHHKGAQDIVDQFGLLGVYADEKTEPGVAGASLAFREVWLPLVEFDHSNANNDSLDSMRESAAEFAKLAGIRDTWRTDDPRWDNACAQAAALMFYGAGYMLDIDRKAGPMLTEGEQDVGRLLLRKRLADAGKLAANAYAFFPGMRVALINNNHLTSDVAEALRELNGPFDLLASFEYKTDPKTEDLICVWSMRSIADDVDVSQIAKANGGGGHTKAAGFALVVSVTENNESPPDMFKAAMRRWRLGNG